MVHRFFVVPKALRLPVAGVDLDEGLVESYPARENPSSWHHSRAENTFSSQYFSALSAFLLPRADVLAEWKSKRWSRNSTHSERGIFLEPNSVPVSGLNERPHPRHEYFCNPSGLLPFLAILSHPHNGHFLGKAKARPKWVLFFLHCLAVCFLPPIRCLRIIPSRPSSSVMCRKGLLKKKIEILKKGH